MKLTSVLIAVNVAVTDEAQGPGVGDRLSLGEILTRKLMRDNAGLALVEARVLSETEVAELTSDFDGPTLTLAPEEQTEKEFLREAKAEFLDTGNIVSFPTQRHYADEAERYPLPGGRQSGPGLGLGPRTYAGGESAA